MQRKGHLGLAIVLLLALATPLHAVAPKAGAKCTKAGSIATASGKKFTCVKVGKKLQWDKGFLVPAKATPSPVKPESSKELSGHEKVISQVESSAENFGVSLTTAL